MSTRWDFAGKTALVVGASGGIGEAIVRKLAGSGAAVVFSALDEAGGRSIEVDIQGLAQNARFVLSDAPDGIRVNVVAPGLTATEAVLRAFPDPQARASMARAQHPMGRLIEPEEIADACLWACSDVAGGVTGLTIPVDGGWAAK